MKTREGIRSEVRQGVEHMGLVGQLQRGTDITMNTVGSNRAF